MRIALVTYSTRARGGVVHTLALAEALADIGHDVTVFGLGRGGDESFFRGVNPAVTVRIVPFPEIAEEELGPRVLRSIATLAPAVELSAFDIIHAQDCISANAVPGRIRTVHHIDHFETPELVRCHDRAIREPRAHVCVSQAVADELWAEWGIRAVVIANGVDAARFAAAAGDAPAALAGRRRWLERIGERYVLAVGGIEPRKGTIDLLEAMAIVQAEHPDIPLVIAGGETLFDYRPYRDAFDRRCRELSVDPVILGPVDDAELPALVAGAAVFAFPSTKEGFGLAAMEAAAAGVPLVVRDLPVLREIFSGAAAFAGHVPDLAAAIASALVAPDTGLVAAGRAMATGFTWAKAAQAHERFYANVLMREDRVGPGR